MKLSVTVTSFSSQKQKIATGDDIVSISEILNNFDIVHNIRSDKFCSIACCYRNTINVNERNYIPAISLLKLWKDIFCQNTVNILLAYRKKQLKFRSFYLFNSKFIITRRS